MSGDIGQTEASDSAEWKRWGSPVIVVGLWLLATLLHVAQQFRFPLAATGTMYMSPVLFLSAGPVIAALVAAAIAKRHGRALEWAASLLVVDCAASVCWLVGQAVYGKSDFGPQAVGWFVIIAAAIASGEVIARSVELSARIKRSRILAVLATIVIVAATPLVLKLDADFALLSTQYWSDNSRAEDAPSNIDAEKLWTIQPVLIDHSLSSVQPSSGTGANAFVLTIAAGGSQKLFGREARVARDVLGHAFGAGQHSVILSNDEKSLYQVPLAANSNLNTVLDRLASKMKPSRDLMIIYLTSHGGADARLMTDLPDFNDLNPIGAAQLAQQLAHAGLKRRVIIVSACHAGSWIRPLANDDTIIIAAARADRSSFGCSDDRELTYFGEALLRGPLAKGASLAESFAAARNTVAEWEGPGPVSHSEPQAFVGKNMQEVWKAPLDQAAPLRN